MPLHFAKPDQQHWFEMRKLLVKTWCLDVQKSNAAQVERQELGRQDMHASLATFAFNKPWSFRVNEGELPSQLQRASTCPSPPPPRN